MAQARTHERLTSSPFKHCLNNTEETKEQGKKRKTHFPPCHFSHMPDYISSFLSPSMLSFLPLGLHTATHLLILQLIHNHDSVIQLD